MECASAPFLHRFRLCSASHQPFTPSLLSVIFFGVTTLSIPLAVSHAHAHARTPERTHAHARTDTRAHTQRVSISASFPAHRPYRSLQQHVLLTTSTCIATKNRLLKPSAFLRQKFHIK
eukprot:6188261-Pleurochrysis_carterae.AAC.1